MTDKKIVAICCPFVERPTNPLIEALEKAIPVLNQAGWKDLFVQERGCPYISAARANMLRRAMDTEADVFVFLDYDMSFDPEDLLRLIESPDECNAGTYRFKKPEEEYMGTLKTDGDGFPLVRADGLIRAEWVPAGFLKITRDGVHRFMRAYPELLYGDPSRYYVDLFNHGAYKGVWYGEDYAFSRRWNECGGQIWLLPNLNLHHHSSSESFKGNFHQFLLAQPGGSNFQEVSA